MKPQFWYLYCTHYRAICFLAGTVGAVRTLIADLQVQGQPVRNGLIVNARVDGFTLVNAALETSIAKNPGSLHQAGALLL
jgi:hypothetical protein